MATPGDRFDELMARLEQMEAFLAGLGYRAAPPAEPPPLEPPPVPMPRVAFGRTPSGRELHTIAAMNALKRSAMERREVEPISLSTDADDSAAVPFAEEIAPRPPQASPPQPSSPQRPPLLPMGTRRLDPSTHQPAPTLEQAIGLKLAGWIGAIVLVIGGAMGVKYGYDQGWLGGLSDEVKLGLLYVIGIAIVGVGEFVHRRVSPLAAVGIFGAGVAMLFVVGYAGNAYYGLYEQHTAFGLMAGACAIGFLIALRGRLVSIAVLSLIGANVAPLVLRQATTDESALLVYLLVLQVLALALAHVGREARWWVLRSLSLVTTGLWIAARLLEFDTAHSPLTIEFATAYAAIFQLELALAAWRRPPAASASASASVPTARFSLATFSLVVTTALTAAFLLWSRGWPDQSRAAGVLLLALIALAAGAAGWTRRNHSGQIHQLVTSWFVQSATLLFAAVPVALAGPWLVIGWATLGVGYAVLGRVIGRRATVVAGVLAWGAALLWLVVKMLMLPHGDLFDRWTTIGSATLPVWFGVALVLVVAGHVISLLAMPRRSVESERDEVPIGDVVAILATTAGVAAAFYALPGLAATALVIGFAWLLYAIGRAARRGTYAWLSLCVAGLVAAKWAATDVIVQRLSATWAPSAQVPFLNETMAVGLLAVGSAVAIAWLSERQRIFVSPQPTRFRFGTAVAMVVLLTVGLSVEVERAVAPMVTAWPREQLAMMGWTVLWLGAALIILPIARLMRLDAVARQLARDTVCGVVAMIAIKFVLFDALTFAFSHARVAALPLLNAQTITAVAVVLAVVIAWRQNAHSKIGGAVARVFVPIVPLVAGSIELDRLIGPEKTLVGLSIFWGVYAIGAILAGFAIRSAAIRIGGLVLLGLTLVKIVLLDLAQAGTGLRILSFLGVGAVLLVTSVLYGKLSPLILEQLDRHRTTPPQS